MEKCFIFGAAEGLPKKFVRQRNDLIIAADAGFEHLRHLGLRPDITVGDFDSLGKPPENGRVVKHHVRKDDTDTLLAVKIGFESGYSNFVLYGCTGKRLDHTFANIQTLSLIASRGGNGLLCGDGFTATVIKNSGVTFSDSADGYISVFSLSDVSDGVCIKGLSFELDCGKLTSGFPLGVSNEFTGKPSEISVKNGELLIIWHGNTDIISF